MAETEVTVLIAVVVLLLVVAILIYKSVYVIKEKQVMVIERLGKFHNLLPPGIHFIIPFIDSPRRHSYSYYCSLQNGQIVQIKKTNVSTISTQNEVLDFPGQSVITKDNARINLDAVLQYCITSPKTMIYTVQNLPNLLSKLLQAQIRNVAGSLDVDQIIEDTAQMDRVAGLMDAAAIQFGVKVSMVKIQRVDAGGLSQVLAQKKQADLKNKEIIIQAKAQKQTTVINAEGNRDRVIKEAEGDAQQRLSRARGQAQAILNKAEAEARSVIEISKAISNQGESPIRYLLSLKYIETIRKISAIQNTHVEMLPFETVFLQTLQTLGLNTIYSSTSSK